MKNRALLLTAGALTLVAVCGCLAIVGFLGLGMFVPSSSQAFRDSPPPLVSVAPDTSRSNQPSHTPLPVSGTRRIIFLHHSVGSGLIQQGGIRERLTALGYEFYDHGYNDEGLFLANGDTAGTSYGIPDDNTNPDGLAALFAQPPHDPPDNAFSHLLHYDVIAFKSCFTASDIQSDEQLAEYKAYYLQIRNVTDQHGDKIFIVVTPPPMVPAETSGAVAARVRTFANWLVSSEFLSGHPNVFAFDLFNLLAENNPLARDNNMLRAAYRGDPSDSHPNEQANQTIGPQFADAISQAIRSYPIPTASQLAVPTAAADSNVPPTAAPVAIAFAKPAGAVWCADSQPPFVVDRQVRQPVAQSEPAPHAPFRDPIFGSCVVRVTDRKAGRSSSDTSQGFMNEYSRVQAFNADGTRLIVRGTSATWYLYDAVTLQPIAELPLQFDPRWDAVDPNMVYYVTWGDDAASPRLMSFNIQTNSATIVHDFGPDFPDERLAAVWTRYEGNPSLDGRYWGMQVEDADWHRIALLVYDQKEDRIIARRDLRGVAGADEIDNTHISSLGNYVVVDFADHSCELDRLGTDASPCGVMVYDRDLKNGRGLLRTMGHADSALDPQGREIVVFQDLDADSLSMVDLATGQVSPLFPIDFSHTALGLHVSGRALARPGWAVVSVYNGGKPNSFTWMDDVIMAVELKPGGRVVRLAHHHSVYDENTEHDYWAEPHASANQDLTRIVFTSNWGRTGTEEVEMYMLQLPPDWTDTLP